MDFAKWQSSLPSPQDAKPYVEAIRRLSHLFCLASLVPVIGDCRFGRFPSSTRGRPVEQPEKKQAAGKAKAKAAAAEPEEAACQEEGEQDAVQDEAPLGVLSVLLLAASELSLCWELFTPVKKKSSGPVPALIDAVKKASGGVNKKSKPLGFMDSSLGFVQNLLKDEDIFLSVHGVAMVVVLSIVLCYVLQTHIQRPGRSFKSQAAAVFKGLVLLLPVGIFVGLHIDTLSKVWRGMVSDKVASTLCLPLRAAALLCARLPSTQADGRGGTPGMFAAFQVASLFAMLSCELVSGSQGIVRALQQFAANPRIKDLIGSPLLSDMAPMVVSLLWLYCAHLSRRTSALLASVLCCCVSQPVLMAMGWPKFAALLQLGQKVGPAHLLRVINVGYTITFLMAVLMGGTLSFVGACALAHLFTRIHGLELLTGLVEG